MQPLNFRAVAIGGDIKSVLGHKIPEPLPSGSHICFEGYWVKKGKLEPSMPENVSTLFTLYIAIYFRCI